MFRAYRSHLAQALIGSSVVDGASPPSASAGMLEPMHLCSFYDTVERSISSNEMPGKETKHFRGKSRSQGIKQRWRRVDVGQVDADVMEVSDKVVSQFQLYKESRAKLREMETEEEELEQAEEEHIQMTRRSGRKTDKDRKSVV